MDRIYVLTDLPLSLNALRGIEMELAAGDENACDVGFHLDVHWPRSKESTGISSPCNVVTIKL